MFTKNNFFKVFGLLLIASLLLVMMPSGGATAQTINEIDLGSHVASSIGADSVSTDAYLGSGSWSSNGNLVEFYLDPDAAPLNMGPITVDDIDSVVYRTKDGTEGGVDWGFYIYTLGDKYGWYEERLISEPLYSLGYDGAPADTWNTWQTDAQPNQMTFYDSHYSAAGFYNGPILADIQEGPIDWSDYDDGYDSTSINYGEQVVQYFKFATGSGWAGSFFGLLDAIELTVSGTTYIIDLEDLFPVTYVDDDWTGTPFGEDPDGSGPANMYGNDAFDNIQDAIDATASGGTVNVYPGTYDETASDRMLFNDTGPYQFGLFFEEEKEGLTLQGIDSAGDPITDYTDVAASITTNATNSFGYSGVFVEADSVTITGLEFLENSPSDNKTIELIGDNFTFRNNVIGVQDYGSLYLNDWRYEEATSTSHVESFTIEDNWFRYSANVSISSGVGVTGDVANRTILNNLFTSDTYWLGISFNGEVPSVPWFNYPVGGALITGNTFEGVGVPIQSRGNVEETDFDWLSYWENNNFDKAVVAWDIAAGMPRSFDYTSGSYLLNNTRRIGTVIQTEVNNAEANDEVWVADGLYIEEILIDKPVHIIGQGLDTIIQSPDEIEQLYGTSSHPIVLIQDTDDVTIENLVIDGAGKGNANYKFVGVAFSNAGGLLQDLTLTGVIDTPFSGAQGGVAVSSYNTDGVTRSISLQDNTFIEFQKNAIALNADASTRLMVDVQRNTITGAGVTDVTAQNGIQVWAAQADGTIANNTVTGIGYSGSGVVGSSILIYQNNFGDLLIDNNTITEAQMGVYVFDGSAMISNNTIEVEKIGDFSYGIIASDPPTAMPDPYGEESLETSVQSTDTRGATLPVSIVNNDITTMAIEENGVAAETWGILAEGGWTLFDLDLTITGNNITGFDYGVEIYQAEDETGEIVSVEAHQNCIIDSQVFAMLSNAEAITVNATNNFWGDPSGPYHLTLNPDGLGGEVSDYIDFEPWLDVCPLIEQPTEEFEYFLPLVLN